MWLAWAAGLSTAKENGFIGSECLKLFLTTVSPGVTHCGEHLLLFLSLAGCVWVFSVRCDTSCSLPWHRSAVAAVGTFETLHSMAKHERDQSTTCLALLPSSVIWSHTKAEARRSPLACDPAYDLCDSRAVVLVLSHYLFHPWHGCAECFVYCKTHGHSTAESVSYWVFCGGNNSFIKS